MKKNKLYWLFALIIIFIASYYREVIFVTINATIKGDTSFYQKSTKIESLTALGENDLILLKYILTILFTLLFMIASLLGLMFGFKRKTAFNTLLIVYTVWLFGMLCILLVGTFLSNFSNTYPYLRLGIGMIHNPLLYLLVTIGTYSSIVLTNNDSSFK